MMMEEDGCSMVRARTTTAAGAACFRARAQFIISSRHSKNIFKSQENESDCIHVPNYFINYGGG